MTERTLLQALDDVLLPEFKDRGPISLEEHADKSTFKKVTLLRTGPAIVLKLDQSVVSKCSQRPCPNVPRMFPLLNPHIKGLTAICDYVIFYQDTSVEGGPLFVFLCELKSGRPGGASKQTANAKMLSELAVNMAIHHGRPTRVPQIAYRGLIFCGSAKGAGAIKPYSRCRYEPYANSVPGMLFAQFADGLSYPLTYFCA